MCKDDVLLDVASRSDYLSVLKRWADLLVRLGLADRFGVYAESVPVAGMGIYLGRHDDRPVGGPERATMASAASAAERERET